jgi:hypothetical protein
MHFSIFIPPSVAEPLNSGAVRRPFRAGPEPVRYQVSVHGRGHHGELFLTINDENLVAIATNLALILSRPISTRSKGAGISGAEAKIRVLTAIDLDDLPATFLALLRLLQRAGPEVEIDGLCDLCGSPALIKNVTQSMCETCVARIRRNGDGSPANF